jgi:hypothetical protein
VAFFAGTVTPRFAISRLVSLITSFKDTSGKRQSTDASFWRGRRPRHRPWYVEPYSTDNLGSRLTLIVKASAISIRLWFERRASSRSGGTLSGRRIADRQCQGNEQVETVPSGREPSGSKRTIEKR